MRLIPIGGGDYILLPQDTPEDIKRKKADWERHQLHKQQEASRKFQMFFWATRHETTFRHSGWAGPRQQVMAALHAAGSSESQLMRFDACAASARVLRDPATDRLRIAAQYCRCRHCRPCQRAKGNMLAANLIKKLEGHATYEYRFITLTLKHSNRPLREQIRRLYHSFKILRRRPVWKQSQQEGAQCSK